MYKKKRKIKMISANCICNILFDAIVLFILALRGLSSPETSRQGNLYGIIGMVIAIIVTFLSIGNFSSGFLCNYFLVSWRYNWSIYSF